MIRSGEGEPEAAHQRPYSIGTFKMFQGKAIVDHQDLGERPDKDHARKQRMIMSDTGVRNGHHGKNIFREVFSSLSVEAFR